MIFHRGQQVTLLVHDWRISIQFACFCFWMTITIMIDASIKPNRKFDFKLESLHVIENRYNSLRTTDYGRAVLLGYPLASDD